MPENKEPDPDRLLELLTTAHADRESLLEENLRLTRRILDLIQAWSEGLGMLMELQHQLETLGETPEGGGVCSKSLTVEEAAESIKAHPEDLRKCLDQTAWPVICPEHGPKIPEPLLDELKRGYHDWVIALFKRDLRIPD